MIVPTVCLGRDNWMKCTRMRSCSTFSHTHKHPLDGRYRSSFFTPEKDEREVSISNSRKEWNRRKDVNGECDAKRCHVLWWECVCSKVKPFPFTRRVNEHTQSHFGMSSSCELPSSVRSPSNVLIKMNGIGKLIPINVTFFCATTFPINWRNVQVQGAATVHPPERHGIIWVTLCQSSSTTPASDAAQNMLFQLKW